MAGILQRGPCKLQHDPLLRIHDLRFKGIDIEEARIELVIIFDDAFGPNIIGIGTQRDRNGWVKFVGPEKVHTFSPSAQILPKRINVSSAWEAPGQPDNRQCAFGQTDRTGVDAYCLRPLVPCAMAFLPSVHMRIVPLRRF